MESYLILLYVTLEQENAIQALFKQQDWLYSRMKFTKNANKEAWSDLIYPRNRLDSSHNGSMESSMELSSFSQTFGSNYKTTANETCYKNQRDSLESEDQSTFDRNESVISSIAKKKFSQNKGDDEVVNRFHDSSSLCKVIYSNQAKVCDDVTIDNSTLHEGVSNLKHQQVNTTSSSLLRSHAQDSSNCDRFNDKTGEDHQLPFEIQAKQEGDDLDSNQPEMHAYGSLQGISSEQVNVSPDMFPTPTKVMVARYFDKFQRDSTFSKKLQRVYQKKNRVLEQTKGNRGMLENQGKGETFKRQRTCPPVSKTTEVGKKRGKGFTGKMKDKVLKRLSVHNKRCEKMILEKSDHKKHLKEVSQDRIKMELEQNVMSQTTNKVQNSGKTKSYSNKHVESMTLENSSGQNECFSEISEKRTVLGLEQIQTVLTVTKSLKNSPVLTEPSSNFANNGKSKMENGRIFCEDCKESFKLAGKFRRHKRDGKCVFHCEFCGKRYISKDYASFMVHRRYHMDNRPYKCEVCNKAYKFEYKLKVHIRNHTGERPWICEVCGARFMAPFNLKQHKLAIHSDEIHICDICGVKLCNKGYLEWHKKFVHSTERPFTCPTCGKSFKSKQNLKNHKVVHDEALAFICDICSKGFKTKTRLNYHVRRHQNDRRHQCETCGKGFYCTKSLREHQMIHSGVKPYKCPTCEYRCTQKGNLDKHIKIHLTK